MPDSPKTQTMPPSPIRGMLYMLGAGLSFSSMVAFVKAGGLTLPVTEVVFARMGINAVFVSLLMYQTGVSIIGKNHKLLLFRALLGTASIGLAFYATTVIPLVNSTIIIKTSVIFTALFAAFWLREKPIKNLYLYTALGFLGVALIVKPNGEFLVLGGLCSLAAAAMIGLTSAVLRRLQETDHSLTIIATYCWFATITYGLLFGRFFVLPDLHEALFLLGAGVAGTVGQFFFTNAFRYAPAGEIAPFLYSEVVFAAIFGALFFAERPDSLTLTGAALTVISGIAIAKGSAAQRAKLKKKEMLVSQPTR